MTYNSFLSVVIVLHEPGERQRLAAGLQSLHTVLAAHFADYEFVLVNNLPELTPDELIEPLPAELRSSVYLINLSTRTNRNHAILAGLDRANGDYTVIFESQFFDHPTLLVDLYQKALEGNDIVYLRAPGRSVNPFLGSLYTLFYYILRHYSDLRVDERAHNTRIISRRALNSILRLRENLRYMKAIYSIVGYRTTFLTTDITIGPDEGLRERFKTSLVAITSYTTFLRSLLLWIFVFSLLFLIGVVVNALKVRFSGVDIFGTPSAAWSGWTFLVILIAIFFAVTCLNLYIMSIYLTNIYSEIKQRPLYIVESVKRF